MAITKAAILVLVWNLCLSSTWSFFGNLTVNFSKSVLKKIEEETTVMLLKALPSVLGSLSLPLSGWLADKHFGNFKVFRAGCVLACGGSVMMCVCILVFTNIESIVASIVLGEISYLMGLSGGCACLVTVFQLSLDQMPDASSAGITKLIMLFMTTVVLGQWISNLLFDVVTKCTYYNLSVQSFSLLPVLCMCVVLSSLFLFGEKWLIIEPKSPQSLKNIYKVLKFAAKHKAPINRSALTYWEEDIPSRLDLGKSRYGGPFTTEQVEDVKTFFRLLLLLLPVWIVLLSANMLGTFWVDIFEVFEHYNQSSCLDHVYIMFTYDNWWCCLITLFVYSFCVYPCVKNKLPTILKRLGTYLFLLTIVTIVYAFSGYYFWSSMWPHFVHSWLLSSLLSLAILSSVEFVCAQSPYNVRGLLTGFYYIVLGASIVLGQTTNNFLKEDSSKQYLIILFSIGGGLSIAGFLLYLVVAGRYKMRVRDEEYFPYVHIEATYDRYLSQANPETCSREHKKKCCVCF